MGVTEKTAILVISFGTSYEETRKKTIEQIESEPASCISGISVIPRMDKSPYPRQTPEAGRDPHYGY